MKLKVLKDPVDDKFHDECGVFGVFGHPEAANITYLGILAGIVASLLLGDPDSLFSARTTTGYLAAIGLLLGGLLGGAVAVLVERPGR